MARATEKTTAIDKDRIEIRIPLRIPFLGNISLVNCELNIRGTPIAIGKFFRLLAQSFLWIAVAFGTAHWVSWTIFDQSYLVDKFEEVAKLTQLLLLFSTTVIVWALTRRDEDNIRSGWPRFLRRMAAWVTVTAGWCYWAAWLIMEIPSGIPGLEEAVKLSLPFFLVCGSFGAWISGSVFQERQEEQDE